MSKESVEGKPGITGDDGGKDDIVSLGLLRPTRPRTAGVEEQPIPGEVDEGNRLDIPFGEDIL